MKSDRVVALISNTLLCISLLATAKMYYGDYLFPFSGAKDMAWYIKKNGLENETTVAYVGSHAEAVLPYFPDKRFWYPELQSFGTYIFPRKEYYSAVASVNHAVMIDEIDRYFPEPIPVIILLSSPLSTDNSSRYVLLHQSSAPYIWSNETESFWLYRRIERV